ncbi:MAG: energy-dependent translational throttle protein EttA [Holosporales bacterium]|jgi:ATP-binding cassette ChvD family protein|nr:energy-dependent translational throttle protein EttA [Holosporales bacterium]
MATYQYIYVMKGVNKVYPGGRQTLKNVWLSFLPGAKIGIIGSNGAGKSTLLKIMAGIDNEIQGEAWAAHGVRVGYLPQEPQLDPSLNVQDNILSGLAETRQLLETFEHVSARFSEPLNDDEMAALIEEQANLQEKIDALDAWDLERKANIAMEALRCPPGDASVVHLSGGERRRVALCRLLMQKPDLLLLDEPTNHLDTESIAWLEQHLRAYKGTVVLVTHDRYFLELVGWILELDRGEAIPFEGSYAAWLEARQKRFLVEGRQEDFRQRVLARELAWVRESPKARQKKSKARLQAYETLLQTENEKVPDLAQIVIPHGPRLGNLVINAQGLKKAFGQKLLFESMEFSLPPGGIVGVIGANGTGKSTLFRLITKQEVPDAGHIVIGDSVKLAYVDQSRHVLKDNHTVWEEISDEQTEFYLGKRLVQSRAYVASFGFRGTDQQKRVGQLSGGERNRVHLARILKEGANVLLLDEPTNDLDVDTLRALEEALLEFAGCAVIITHDRWFLDRIATHILAFEGDSRVVWFEGNYAAYEEDKKRRLGPEAETPHRVHYRSLQVFA